jgi:hypothetical protein
MEGNDTPSEVSLLDTGTAPAVPAAGTETQNGNQQQAAAASGDAAAGSAASAKPFVNTDGTLADGWVDNLPEETAAYKSTFSKYKTVPDMAKALASANHLIGKKLGVPTDKSSPEEVAAFRQALGVPEKVEEYKFAPTALPEGITWSEDLAKPFAEIAHKHNVPPGAMAALADQFAKFEAAKVGVMQEQYDMQRKEGIASLQKEWGGKFSENIGVAKQAAKLAGVDSNSHGFSDPEVVRGFVRLAAMMSEDKVGRAGGAAEMLSGAARAKDIMTNSDNAWHKRYQEGDPEAVALVTGLLKNK